MAAITGKEDPFIFRLSYQSTQISRHVTRGLNNPKGACAEKIKCFLERPKSHPWAIGFLKLFGSLSGIKEAPVPLHVLGVGEVPWRAEFLGSGAKKEAGVRKLLAHGPAVIPMRVARGASYVSALAVLPKNEEMGKDERGLPRSRFT